MAPRPIAEGARTIVAGPGLDPFAELDEEFQSVQRALLAAGLDRDELAEVGRAVMVALWRCSAGHRPRGPELVELATALARALRPAG
jgi:hypothetical protein